MMVLTFIIGFVVAGVIKGIAMWADSLDYHHSHAAEQEQFNRIFHVRAKIGEMLGLVSPRRTEKLNDEREDFARGKNSDQPQINPGEYYHGVSHGASQLNLIDYYYPRDTRFMYLKKKKQMLEKLIKEKQDKNRNKDRNNNLSPEE